MYFSLEKLLFQLKLVLGVTISTSESFAKYGATKENLNP
jgi:hypothetical protein